MFITKLVMALEKRPQGITALVGEKDKESPGKPILFAII